MRLEQLLDVETRAVVHERLDSQTGVHLVNRLANSMKNAVVPEAIKTRPETIILSQAFYNTDEFMEFNWDVLYKLVE